MQANSDEAHRFGGPQGVPSAASFKEVWAQLNERAVQVIDRTSARRCERGLGASIKEWRERSKVKPHLPKPVGPIPISNVEAKQHPCGIPGAGDGRSLHPAGREMAPTGVVDPTAICTRRNSGNPSMRGHSEQRDPREGL